MVSRAQLVGIIAAVVLLWTGVGLAISGGVGVSGTITIESADGPTVDVVTNGGELVLDGPAGSNTVEVEHDNGLATFESSSATLATVDTTQLEGDTTRVTSIDASTSALTITPGDKPSVTVDGGINEIEWSDATVGDSNVDFSYSASSSGTVDVATDTANADLLAVNSNGQVIDQSTSDTSGRVQFTVDGSNDIFINRESPPVFDGANASPQGSTVISEVPTALSVNVSDKDFDRLQGDEVNVTFYDASDDSVLDSTTITSNGTASGEFSNPEGGTNSWYAVATDEYGNKVTSSTFEFQAPDEMRIYSETEPTQLIDEDVSLRVRFFVDGEEQVIEREVSDGTVSLQGLPVNQRFIATVRANDTTQFTYRRVVVDSLVETEEVYLLNRSEPNSEIIYRLDDPTGDFPPEETTLYVEKPITKDHDGDGTNETRYQVIAGDVFGASAQFPVVLQQDTRYRLRVESESGNSRILGAYSVTGDAVEPLQIQAVQLRGEADAGASLTAAIESEGSQRRIAIRYRDLAEETEQVEYRVVNEQTGNVYVNNTTREGQEFADFYSLPANASENPSYAVEYTIDRESGTESGKVYAGQLGEVVDRFGLGTELLRLVFVVGVLAAMGLVVIVNPRLAPLTGTGVATIMNLIGVFAVPNPVLGVAGAISILVVVGGRS